MMYKTCDTLFYTFLLLISIIVNIVAIMFQFLYYELPCPLCLLQRFGFIGIGFGAMLNLTRSQAAKYDLIITVSSVFVIFVALRQILLHIAPNDPGYGKILLGLHFYTWSAIASFVIILLMVVYKLYSTYIDKLTYLTPYIRNLLVFLKITFILAIVINIIFTYLECGMTACPDNPTTYIMLSN